MPRWIQFEEEPRRHGRKTGVWTVRTRLKGLELGRVHWYAAWRRFCFVSGSRFAVYDAECLRDIASFCEEQTLEHREALRQERAAKG